MSMRKTALEIDSRAVSARLERTLPRVATPGRYSGGELNSVRKGWDQVEVRLALAFPDIYDLGMSNLGLMILYDLVNQRDNMLAERVFSPWVDMEAIMRQAELPLFSLESRHPVAQFDVLGISLPYEQLYTNTLNLLDLAGIPLLSVDRGSRDPLVIAGGHATLNPEPMADFVDAFLIGDGEEVLLEVLEQIANSKRGTADRLAILQRLSQIPGVYVPQLYQVSFLSDGTIGKVTPTGPEVPDRILRRIVAQLPPPVVRPIVPFIRTTHDRAAIEIMRGCTRGCRFCHAGFVTRPVRERPVDEIVRAADLLLTNSGYEDLALLSLSSSDYSQVHELIAALNARFPDRGFGISLPSLRIETASADLMEATGGDGGRKSSATFAPEAATDHMRRVINKDIPEAQLLEVTEEIFRRGWRTVKLYFMIGHPRETLDDVRAIAELARSVLMLGRRHHGRRARVNLGISTLIPKPHTPFQWSSLDTVEQINAKLQVLKQGTAGQGLEMKWNAPEETLLEALLGRGDRRLGRVIQRAWELGAKFDSWHEYFDFRHWLAALDEAGLTLDFYIYRTRALDEILPWDHIETGVNKSYLQDELLRSQRSELQPDCRCGCLACGILTAYGELRQHLPTQVWQCP
jgi:radical SAM family uncharacterized protein